MKSIPYGSEFPSIAQKSYNSKKNEVAFGFTNIMIEPYL
jgi:hypothetical protein